MNWIDGMQRALDYIEEHLTEEMDTQAIARCAYVSEFHFQRIFGAVCGMTLSEDIRKRRLTLAAEELSLGKVRVIDASLRYGYDSPDSFSRAFTRFHGVPPSAARENSLGGLLTRNRNASGGQRDQGEPVPVPLGLPGLSFPPSRTRGYPWIPEKGTI